MLAAETAVALPTNERDARYEFNAPKVWVEICLGPSRGMQAAAH